MIQAIVFQTRTGFTQEYAELLGEHTGLPVLSRRAAAKTLPQGAEIVYLGWLCAGKVKGLPAAARRWKVVASATVGMGLPDPDKEVEDVIRNPLPQAPMFYLRGGLRRKRLGYYATIIGHMQRAVVPYLERQAERTESEDALYEVLKYGGSYVDVDYLSPLEEYLAGLGVAVNAPTHPELP